MTQHIYWVGDVDEDEVQSKAREVEKAMAKGRPLLFLTSDGGSVRLSLSFYNLFVDQIDTTAIGKVASSAVGVYLTGRERVMASGSSLQLHPGGFKTTGSLEEVRAGVESLAEADALYWKVHSERTGLPLQEIKALVERCAVIKAEEAVELGFAHRIVTPPLVKGSG